MASHLLYGSNTPAGHRFGNTSRLGVKRILTIRFGRITLKEEEPFGAVVRFTSPTLQCPDLRSSRIVTASLHVAFERLELCELETLTHSS
jgi:hypothetical protein